MSNFGPENQVAAKNGRLNRADILAAALLLLDQVGLPDLSMRRLAATLEMQPSGLYWHFENKQTLLARISDHIVDHAVKPATPIDNQPQDWQRQATLNALALRDALLAFRDGAEVVSSTLALGLGAQQALERLLEPLISAKIDPEIARVAAESILFLVLGQVWHLQQRMAADSLGLTAPAVATSPANLQLTPSSQPLESGIALILAGLSQHLVSN